MEFEMGGFPHIHLEKQKGNPPIFVQLLKANN